MTAASNLIWGPKRSNPLPGQEFHNVYRNEWSVVLLRTGCCGAAPFLASLEGPAPLLVRPSHHLGHVCLFEDNSTGSLATDFIRDLFTVEISVSWNRSDEYMYIMQQAGRRAADRDAHPWPRRAPTGGPHCPDSSSTHTH
jgi:hypothetical protein